MDMKECLQRLPKTIDEINLQLYLDFSKELRGVTEAEWNTIDGQLKMFRIVELFLGVEEGDIDDLSLADMTELVTKVTDIISSTKDFKSSDHFVIDGITYSTRKIEDMNSLTTGEYTSIKTLQDSMKDELDFLPYVLAILIRPAKEVVDEETGESKLVQDKFNQRDIDNLEWRVKLFREKALAKDLIPVCSFFLNGKK